jgi:uncharacterized PurR-regulated membrane protein YhhQ (DUF165 family)
MIEKRVGTNIKITLERSMRMLGASFVAAAISQLSDTAFLEILVRESNRQIVKRKLEQTQI